MTDMTMTADGQLPDYEAWKSIAKEMEPRGFDPSVDELGMAVSFFRPGPDVARLDEAKSEQENRPIYRDEVWVKVQAPGDTKNVIMRPALMETRGPKWPSDIDRFPKAWARFQAGDVEQDGTKLEFSGIVSGHRCAELKAMGVHTVEQLAAVNDTSLPRLGMGARELRDKAVRMTQPADQAMVEVKAENQSLKQQMAAMQAQIDQMILQGQQKAAQATTEDTPEPEGPDETSSPDEPRKRRPGRPRKDAT